MKVRTVMALGQAGLDDTWNSGTTDHQTTNRADQSERDACVALNAEIVHHLGTQAGTGVRFPNVLEKINANISVIEFRKYIADAPGHLLLRDALHPIFAVARDPAWAVPLPARPSRVGRAAPALTAAFLLYHQ